VKYVYEFDIFPDIIGLKEDSESCVVHTWFLYVTLFNLLEHGGRLPPAGVSYGTGDK
jgi:hypothetical protein